MNRELTEDEQYAIEIQEWLVGLEEAVEAIKEGKPLTEVQMECLESALDSLTNTFAEELGVADNLTNTDAQ